jgi:hypothetical protein
VLVLLTQHQQDNTREVKSATSALSKLGATVASGVLSAFGSIIHSGVNMGKAFIDGSDKLADFAGELPLVGVVLKPLARLFDDSFTAFQNVASSGAAFNNSLTDLRSAAAGARMPVNEFASMISANSDKLAAFGGTATGGAEKIVKLNKALGTNREQLLTMGLSYQNINEALIDYQYLQRAGNRGIQLNQEQLEAQATSAAAYTKNLVTLGKLTGQDVKSQQAKIAAAQMDVAMQAKLGKLGTEERKKMDLLMANTMATGGQAAVDALKREFLGMPPLTQEAALYTTQFGENMKTIQGGLRDVYDTNVDSVKMQSNGIDFMMNMIKGNAATFARLEPGMTAAAAGLDGPMATIAEQLRSAGIQFTDFIDKEGNVKEKELRAALENAKKEADASDTITIAMVKTKEALAGARSAFETSVISPLMNAVAPALLELTKYLNNFVNSPEFKKTMDSLKGYFGELKDKLIVFIDAFKADPKKAMSDMFSSAMSGLGSLLGDAIIGVFTSPKFIGAMIIGIGALWAAGAVAKALTSSIGSVASKLIGGSSIAAPATPSAKANENAGKGVGNAIGNIGGGIGKGLGGILSGLASGISAFANPMVVAGAAALGAAIVLIGGAIAGATWLVGKSLPTMAEGLKSFEALDGQKLIDTGKGMGAIALGMAAFGAGSAVAGLGSLVGGISEGLVSLFGGDNPLTKLEEFQKYDLDAARIENNANALVSYSKGIAALGGSSAISGIGSVVGAIGSGITALFGADDPLTGLLKFQA